MRKRLAIMLCTLFIAGCGSGLGVQGNQTRSGTTQPAQTQLTASFNAKTAGLQQRLSVRVRAVGRLPLGLVGNALAADGHGRIYSVGGYTGQVSVQDVVEIVPAAAKVASLPEPSHDAAAGFIGPALFVIGGGQSASYDTLVRVVSGRAETVGYLSRPLSDAVSVPYVFAGKHGLLLVGGYDGAVYRQKVEFVYESGGQRVWRTLFTLPVGLRYPAVAAGQSGAVYIAGGRTPGGLSRTVWMWKPQTGLRKVAQYAYGFEKAAAFAVGSNVVIAGGLNSAGTPSSDIRLVDVKSGRISIIGHLPTPLADMGYTQVGQTGYLAGGMKSASVSDNNAVVYELTFH